MPDKKITDLVDGAPLQATDEFVVARAGDNFKIDGAEVVAAVTKHDVTISGNTAGALAAISSGTMTLAGGNNITLSQAGNAVTISGANVGGAQTGISAIANSETTYTSGSVTLSELGAITIRSTTGQQFQFSVNPQSVQPETQTFIAGISASDTLYTSGNVRFTGVGGGITVSSNTGQRVDLSVAAQSVQPETQTFVGGIGNSQTTYTSGTVNLSVVAGNLTIRSTTGQAFQFSMSQSPETQTGISGIANSQTTYTSGTVSLSELGAITIRSTTGNQYQLSVNSQTVQTQGILSAGVSSGGNTAGNTTVNTGSRFVLVASGNATASQATAAGASTVTISVGTQTVQTQDVLSVGVSTGGNTSGNTTVNTGSRFVIVGSNGITASQGTAAGATTVTLSGITQSVQTQDVLSVGVSTGGNTAGNTTVNTGSRFVIVGSNGITASQGTAAGATTVTLSGVTQSVQTNDIPRLGVSTGGNTAGDTTVNSGTRFVLVGSNMVSLSQATAASASTITINATQSVQSQGILSVGASNIGNTSGDTTVNTGSRLVIAGGNNITISQGTAAGATTLTISAPNLGAGAMSVGVSTGGNTAGATGITGTQLVLVGTGPVSLSQTTGANGGTVSINAPATSSLSATGIVSISTNGSTISVGAPAYSGGMSTHGNTAGDTGYASQRLNLVGSNNITLSGSTNGGSMSISIIGASGGGAGFSAGVSTGGNTAGDTGVTGTRMVFVGVSPMSLSQATAAAGGTISINAPATSSLSATGNIQISTNGSTISVGDGGATLDFYDNQVGGTTQFELSNAALNIYPLNPNAGHVFPGYMSVSTIFLDMTGTVSTAASFTRSLSLGFYTRVNSTQLSLSASASTSWGTNAANMNVNDSFAGRRWLTFHSSLFNNPPNFSNGSDYFFAVWHRSSSGSQSFSLFGATLPYATGVRSGFMSVASATNTTLGQYPFLGNYSVSFTTAMPNALAASDVNKSNATAISFPRVIFNNVGSNVI